MKSFRVCLAALLLLTPVSQAEEGKVILEEAFSGELSKEWFCRITTIRWWIADCAAP